MYSKPNVFLLVFSKVTILYHTFSSSIKLRNKVTSHTTPCLVPSYGPKQSETETPSGLPPHTFDDLSR